MDGRGMNDKHFTTQKEKWKEGTEPFRRAGGGEALSKATKNILTG
jgi:hypothetical protein